MRNLLPLLVLGAVLGAQTPPSARPRLEARVLSVGEAIVEATRKGGFSLVGGGDSVACVNQFGFANGVSYISTAGGALLEYLEGRDLPGVSAVRG